MSEDTLDKEAIVARRALFVGTTLAALSCSSPEKVSPDAAVETVGVPMPGSAPASSGSALPREQPPGSWASIMAGAPPLDAPPASAGVSEQERTALAEQAKAMRAAYDALGKAWEQGPPECPPESCRSKWEETARQISNLVEGMRGPLCGWAESEPISTIERDGAHRRFLQKQAGALEKRFAEAAKRAGQTEAWEKIRMGGVVPHPCLSCVAPKPRVFQRVSFAEASTDIDKGAEELLGQVKQILASDPTMRLSVRGHADSKEAGDKAAIAKKRAEVVVAFLVKSGVAQSRLVATGLGDAVPIASSNGDERVDNRRVDFERAP